MIYTGESLPGHEIEGNVMAALWLRVQRRLQLTAPLLGDCAVVPQAGGAGQDRPARRPQAGELPSEVCPPTPAEEAVRDLCRRSAREDLQRSRHRRASCCCRRGLHYGQLRAGTGWVGSMDGFEAGREGGGRDPSWPASCGPRSNQRDRRPEVPGPDPSPD